MCFSHEKQILTLPGHQLTKYFLRKFNDTLYWNLSILSTPRATNAYRNYQDTNYTKYFLRSLPEIFKISRKGSKYFSQDKCIQNMPRQCLNKAFLFYITWPNNWVVSILSVPRTTKPCDITRKKLIETFLT